MMHQTASLSSKSLIIKAERGLYIYFPYPTVRLKQQKQPLGSRCKKTSIHQKFQSWCRLSMSCRAVKGLFRLNGVGKGFGVVTERPKRNDTPITTTHGVPTPPLKKPKIITGAVTVARSKKMLDLVKQNRGAPR